MADDRCEHGRLWACPFRGCERGIAGDQLIICGPEGVVYLERGLTVEGGEVRAGWVRKAATGVGVRRRAGAAA